MALLFLVTQCSPLGFTSRGHSLVLLDTGAVDLILGIMTLIEGF